MGAAISRAMGLRPGEWRFALPAFAVLFLLIAGHTTLETARDALLLTRLSPRLYGALYVAAAAAVLVTNGFTGRMSERFGLRRTLGGALLVAAATGVVLFMLPTTRVTVFLLYVASTLIGAVIAPLYWNLLASTLTIAEGRRLLGPISAAGVVGGAVGSLAAAALLSALHVKSLLLLAAVPFLGSVLVLRQMHADEPTEPATPALGATDVAHAMREEPFLRMIALLVLSSTVAMFALDYFFKWSVARFVPHHEVARFVARYYALLNASALVTQFFVGGAIARRLGVGTLLISPAILVLGSGGVLAAGGALIGLLVLKGVDGATRTPLHRVTTEMLYLPMSARVRLRAKPYIDGSLARIAQGAVGLVFLGLAAAQLLTPRLLGSMVLATGATWLAVALVTRREYFGLLRRALTGGIAVPDPTLDPLDFESAEALVASLADDDPLVVVGAMEALTRRGRDRLIPALVLLHPDAAVVTRALEIFAASRREDWVRIARRLLTDARDEPRMAAARALAMHGRLETVGLAEDGNARVRGYAALHVARAAEGDPLDEPGVKAILEAPDDRGREMRLGLVSAIADLPADPRLTPLLLAIEARAGASREWVETLAKAAASQGATGMIPFLVASLARVEVREAVIVALVSLGDPAKDAIWTAFLDRSRPRSLRAQLPGALGRFGTSDVAMRLLTCIETEQDGLLRYKAIRALGRLVTEHHVKVDRPRVERQALANLGEHYRLVDLRAAFDAETGPVEVGTDSHGVTTRLLARLIDDKIHQSLERTFRLLKVAYPREDIHRVYVAVISADKRARANASEFLRALLRRASQPKLRDLLVLVADDLPRDARLTRAFELLGGGAPSTRERAFERLLHDPDSAIASLAALLSGARAEALADA